MKAVKQQKILEATKKREERIHGKKKRWWRGRKRRFFNSLEVIFMPLPFQESRGDGTAILTIRHDTSPDFEDFCRREVGVYSDSHGYLLPR